MSGLKAIYILWLREMKRFVRSKSRIIGMLSMPLMFLAFFGLGFSGLNIPGLRSELRYIDFLVPGIIGMGLLFNSMFAGISVLWDREFGFLKEIMVAPVKRIHIVLGRIAGGATIALIQGILILLISILAGFALPSLQGFLISIIFMLLISTTFIGLGLAFASKMKDMQGFNLIMNFIIFPLFFLSGAIFPIDNLPTSIKIISLIDPLTYGIDGLRFSLIGFSMFNIIINLFALICFSVFFASLGTYLFEKSESV
ncbi:MAG: ABC transporter permease [Candidatus Aenigmatarchaeota archaeon]